MSTLFLIPAHNEAPNLGRVLAEIRARHPQAPILVVDDASTDETPKILPELGVEWLQLGQHMGIGNAVRAGLRYARIQGHDRVVRLDADGQHAPDQVDELLEPLAEGRADAVVGSRFGGVPGHRPGALTRVMQWALALALSRITGRRVTDPTSGFWAFGPRAVALLADHHPRGYSEPELRLFLARNGLQVLEVPVRMRHIPQRLNRRRAHHLQHRCDVLAVAEVIVRLQAKLHTGRFRLGGGARQTLRNVLDDAPRLPLPLSLIHI